MAQVKEWTSDFLESGEKLVIFAHHREVVDELYNSYKEIAVKLTGESSTQERQSAVDQFQGNANVRLFIGNIKAAGLGITLTASSNVLFIELPWTPGEVIQAEDRLHRIGQKNAVNVYYLVGRNTIEETIVKLLHEKASVIDALMDGRKVPEFDLLSELVEMI